MSGNSSPESTGDPVSKKRKKGSRESGAQQPDSKKPTTSDKPSSSNSQSASRVEREDTDNRLAGGGGSFRIPKKQKPDVGDKGGRSALPNQGPIGDTWKVNRGGIRSSWKPRGERGRGRGGGGNFEGTSGARKGPVFPLDEILPLNPVSSRKPGSTAAGDGGNGDRSGQHPDKRPVDFAKRSRDFGSRLPRNFGDRPIRDLGNQSRDFGHRPHEASDELVGATSPGSDGDRQSLADSKCSSATNCSVKRQNILKQDFVQVAETDETVKSWLIASQPHQEQILADPDIAAKYEEENKCGNDEEEPMEVEDVVSEIQELRGNGKRSQGSEKVCGELTLLSKREDPKVTSSPIPSDVTDATGLMKNAEQIFVVLDTNVLLADLTLVDEIMNSRTGENNFAMAVLLVPWVVMQELDTLKDDKRNLNPKLKLKAIKAVKYLHEMLTTGHPQLRGQTAKEAREDVGISIECNDDRILQCCLQYEKVHKNVILFTNDRNLCSKAVINCIGVQSNEGIVAALNRISPLTTNKDVPLPVHDVADLCQVNKTYNTTALQLKTFLRDILSRILETEMIDAYGEIWKQIILVKPPWRLMDIIKCFTKHWIAVFGQFLGQHAKTQLDIMHQKLKSIASAHNHENLKVLLGASIHFLACFEKRTAYKIQLTYYISDLRSLLSDLKAIKNTKLGKIASIVAVENGTGNNKVQQPAKKNVIDTLNSIWNFINNTSGLLLDSLQINNPIVYTRPSTLATESDCMIFIPKFLPVLMKLKNLMQGVLLLPPTAPSNQPEYANLCYQIENFFNILEMDSDAGHSHLEENLTPQMLWEFYTDDINKELLQRGYLQLEDFCTLIYQCALKIRDKF